MITPIVQQTVRFGSIDAPFRILLAPLTSIRHVETAVIDVVTGNGQFVKMVSYVITLRNDTQKCHSGTPFVPDLGFLAETAIGLLSVQVLTKRSLELYC